MYMALISYPPKGETAGFFWSFCQVNVPELNTVELRSLELGGLCKFVREIGSSSQPRSNYYNVDHMPKGFLADIGQMINT
jgi:hypothetical protein